MKISELNTKSFLGHAGAAENSYILINYEDNSTSEPVTYKASLQELGKAIANDQKLYKKTQNGAITTNVSQDTYVNTAAENFASTGAVTAAVNGLASIGYVTNAVSGLVSNDGVKDIIDTYFSGTFSGIDASAKLIYGVNSSLGSGPYITGIGINPIYTNTLVSIGDLNGLASTGYVTAAVANAGGGGFDPTEHILCSVIPYGGESSDPIQKSLYHVMADESALYGRMTASGPMEYIIPLDKMLFYDIHESDGGSRILLLKDRDNATIHSIPLN